MSANPNALAMYLRQVRAVVQSHAPGYFGCGGCGQYHPRAFTGDCRDDGNRFAPDELDAIHGRDGWCEVRP